jgi:PAS domain S-box-containing protein
MEFLRTPFLINRTTRRTIIIGSVLLPLLFVLYSVFALMHLRSSDGLSISYLVSFMVSLLWLVFALYELSIFPRISAGFQFKFVIFHIIAAGLLLGVFGFSSPLTYCWIFMITASYMYFGQNGLIYSTAVVPIIAIADILVNDHGKVAIVYNSIATVVICATGLLVAGAMRGTRIDQQQLDDSQSQADALRERFAVIMNNLADAVMVVDKQGKISVFNAAALNLVDTNDSLIGKNVDDILPLYDITNQPSSITKLIAKMRKTTNDDSWYTKLGDEDVHLDITISMSGQNNKSSKPDEFIIMLRDITAQKNLEREKDEFIAVVSHELRTPIAIAEGTISNALVMYDRPNIPKKLIEKAINGAHTQVTFLARMVNDLSTLSSADRGVGDTAEIIDCDQLLHKLYNQHLDQAHKKSLSLDLSAHTKRAFVYCSRLYLEELLQNFITNAIKYTKTGTITISGKLEKDRIVFAVKDSGIGISKSDQKHIFERFYRAEDFRTRETSGTGLGLYVAAKLATKLGTKIEVTSRLNHGSTFKIALPTVKRH